VAIGAVAVSFPGAFVPPGRARRTAALGVAPAARGEVRDEIGGQAPQAVLPRRHAGKCLSELGE